MMNLFISLHYRNRRYGNDHYDKTDGSYSRKVKQARQAKNLTQEELGERIGVQKAQISRLEKGKNITISSLMRLFEAMEVPLTLEMGGIGKISLC